MPRQPERLPWGSRDGRSVRRLGGAPARAARRLGAAIALAHEALGLYGVAVFPVPLLLMLKTMAAHMGQMRRSSDKLSEAASAIRRQNASLEQANRGLPERSTAALERLSATADARDAYTRQATPVACMASRSRSPGSSPLADGARPPGLACPDGGG